MNLLLNMPDPKLGLPIPTEKETDKQISEVKLFVDGPIVERAGVLEISDGKSTYGAFPVSYFAPK